MAAVQQTPNTPHELTDDDTTHSPVETSEVRASYLPTGIERRRGGDTLDGLLLRTLLSTAPIGIAFCDRDLRFLRINEAMAEMHGLTVGEHLGRTISEIVPNLPAELLRRLHQIISTGEPIVNVELDIPAAQESDETRHWLASYYPVRDERRNGEIIGIGAVVTEITDRKQAEEERERLVLELTALAEKQRRFVREMLTGVTGGRLSLCDSEADLPEPLPVMTDLVPLSIASLRHLRKDVATVCRARGFSDPRWQDLETAVGEAAMNAVVHANGGVAWVCSPNPEQSDDRVQVWIKDRGYGIAEERLHRATLERGYTTAGTLGHGFWMMLQTADRTYLLTGPTGTTIVLEQYRTPPKPIWFQGL